MSSRLFRNVQNKGSKTFICFHLKKALRLSSNIYRISKRNFLFNFSPVSIMVFFSLAKSKFVCFVLRHEDVILVNVCHKVGINVCCSIQALSMSKNVHFEMVSLDEQRGYQLAKTKLATMYLRFIHAVLWICGLFLLH